MYIYIYIYTHGDGKGGTALFTHVRVVVFSNVELYEVKMHLVLLALLIRDVPPLSMPLFALQNDNNNNNSNDNNDNTYY